MAIQTAISVLIGILIIIAIWYTQPFPWKLNYLFSSLVSFLTIAVALYPQVKKFQ